MAETELNPTIFVEMARFQGARFIASGSALLVVAQVVEDAAKKEG